MQKVKTCLFELFKLCNFKFQIKVDEDEVARETKGMQNTTRGTFFSQKNPAAEGWNGWKNLHIQNLKILRNIDF